MKIVYVVVTGVILVAVVSFALFFYLNSPDEEEGYRVAYMGALESSPYWIKLGKTIIETGQERGVIVDGYTSFSREDETKEIMAERILKENYDAVLLGSGFYKNFSLKFAKNLEDFGVPVFVIDTRIDGNFTEGFVATDNYGSGKVVGEYLLGERTENGEVLIVASNMAQDIPVARVNGAKDFLEGEGVVVKVLDPNSLHWAAEDVREGIMSEFAEDPNYFAVFSVWDEAIVVIRETVEEISDAELVYVGFDGLDFVLEDISEGHISATVMQDLDSMAGASFDQILAELEGREFEEEILVSGVLVDDGNVGEYVE